VYVPKSPPRFPSTLKTFGVTPPREKPGFKDKTLPTVMVDKTARRPVKSTPMPNTINGSALGPLTILRGNCYPTSVHSSSHLKVLKVQVNTFTGKPRGNEGKAYLRQQRYKVLLIDAGDDNGGGMRPINY
jgi:hypothetical protein